MQLKKFSKRFILIVFILINIKYLYADNLEIEDKTLIENFVNILKNEDKIKLSKLISYPIKLKYISKTIKNEKEFIKNYDLIFNKDLVKKIINSNLGMDWKIVGFRGIMLDNGLLWLDFDGKVKAINYDKKI